jgi:tetratricopeptide (TPR) repeat protein
MCPAKPQAPANRKDIASAQAPETADPALEALLKKVVKHLTERNFAALEEVLQKAASIAPDDARVLHFQGLSAFEQHNAKTAFALIRRAVAKNPRDAIMQHNMAAVLISLGDFTKAEQLLRSAIQLRPSYAEAYHTLAQVCEFDARDPLIREMEEGLARPGLSKTDISFFAFALAHACDKAELPDRVWPALVRGNAAMPHLFDPDHQSAAIDRLLQVATRDRLEELGRYGHPSPGPLLIVGLPRSGTTLLERVIADHPQVYAAGELTALGGIGRQLSQKLGINESRLGYAEALERLTPQHAYAAGLGYLNATRRDASTWFDHVVDKLPDNSFNLGLAAALLPAARVIHIMRHPLDVMLSIFMQRFTALQYGFRPTDILHHYQNYRRTMAHWRKHLPLEMIELRYENLVQDVDFARALLWDRLGLTRDIAHVPALPGASEQRTASRFQVRQPVYQSSKQKFRRYEAFMGEFIEGLGGMARIEKEVADQEACCALRAAAG